MRILCALLAVSACTRHGEAPATPAEAPATVEPPVAKMPSELPALPARPAQLIAEPQRGVRKLLGKPAAETKDADQWKIGAAELTITYDAAHAVQIDVHMEGLAAHREDVEKWLGAEGGKVMAGNRPCTVSWHGDVVQVVDDAYTERLGQRAVSGVERGAAATALEGKLRAAGNDVTLSATGDEGRTLRIDWAKCDRAAIGTLLTGSDGKTLSDLRHVGFNKAECWAGAEEMAYMNL
jgi:hypothetical protein